MGRVVPGGSSIYDDIVATLRQWRFHPSLRIGPAERPPWKVAIGRLEEIWRQLERGPDRPSKRPGPDFDPALVRALVTTFWKLEAQVARMTASGESRTLRNRLRQLSNVMKTHDIQVYDYSGKAYDPDEIWDEVVADETRKADPVIVGMREPRIVYRGDMLQRGTPIVEDRASAASGGGQE